jgi:hypothetical protein
MTKATAQREARLRTPTEMVAAFDPSNPIHVAHYNALKGVFGEIGAAMLVSQDAATSGGAGLELTDPGQINSHAGWRKLNRAVRHGSTSYYTIFDFAADTQVGGRIIAMFTRDQTVPSYTQED